MAETLERFADVAWQDFGELARQKVIDNGEKRVRLLELHAGFYEQEWCERGHTGYVVAGTVEVEFGDEVQSFSQGDALLISRGHPHKARTTTGPATLFLVDEV